MPERYNFLICALQRKRPFSNESLIGSIAATLSESLHEVASIRLMDLSNGLWTNLTSLGISRALAQEPKHGELLFVYYYGPTKRSGTLPSISIDNDWGLVVAVSLDRQEVDEWGQNRLLKVLASLHKVSSNFFESPVVGAGPELSVDLASKGTLSIQAQLCAIDLIDWIVTATPIEPSAECASFCSLSFEGVTLSSKRPEIKA